MNIRADLSATSDLVMIHIKTPEIIAEEKIINIPKIIIILKTSHNGDIPTLLHHAHVH